MSLGLSNAKSRISRCRSSASEARPIDKSAARLCVGDGVEAAVALKHRSVEHVLFSRACPVQRAAQAAHDVLRRPRRQTPSPFQNDFGRNQADTAMVGLGSRWTCRPRYRALAGKGRRSDAQTQVALAHFLFASQRLLVVRSLMPSLHQAYPPQEEVRSRPRATRTGKGTRNRDTRAIDRRVLVHLPSCVESR